MTTTNIIHKKSSVPGKIPTILQLEYGELAVNTADATLSFKYDSGAGPQITTLFAPDENRISINSNTYNNTTSTTLAGVLKDLDDAISLSTVGGVAVDPISILGSGNLANPFYVTLDSVLSGGNSTDKDIEVNNLTVNGTLNGDIVATDLSADAIALAIALG